MMNAKTASQARRLESILKEAPRCGLMLDIYPDYFTYKADGRTRRMAEFVSFSSARDAVKINYGSATEWGRGKITLHRGHDCFPVAAVLAGMLDPADALKTIRKAIQEAKEGKAFRTLLDTAVCIIRNASAAGLADEIRNFEKDLSALPVSFLDSLSSTVRARLDLVSEWLRDIETAINAETVQPSAPAVQAAETAADPAPAAVQPSAPAVQPAKTAADPATAPVQPSAADPAPAPVQPSAPVQAPETVQPSAPVQPAETAPDPAPAADERPETISNDKEQEETTMKTTAETVQETTAETVSITPEELAEFHAQWEADRLAEIRPEWRPHVTAIMAAFPAVYNRLYNADCPDRDGSPIDYSADTALFDAWMKATIWKEFISACAAYRGDCFTSDRETAAFVIACRETREARKAFTVQPSAANPAPAADERPETISAADERPETISAENAPEKAARGPVKEKDFAGGAIAGNGWCIVFDTGLNRTRVIVSDPLRDRLSPMIEKAGFYFSRAQNSWNKKLTHRAHRAALALADEIRTALAS